MAAQLEPSEAWINDWLLGVDPTREADLARSFVDVFARFWVAQRLSEKSETTRRRHSGSLRALGGHLVKEGVEPEYSEWTAHELLWEAVEIGEGPMIFGGDEAWQGELDATCRRLRRYLEAQR